MVGLPKRMSVVDLSKPVPRDMAPITSQQVEEIEESEYVYTDEKIGRIIQVNLTAVHCAECNKLLLQASKGSVVSILCSRCGSYSVIEVR
jgi:hypothetical protein